MARFAKSTQAAPSNVPWSIGPHPTPAFTHELGLGAAPSDPHVELFNGCVSGFLADQFYESGDARIERVKALVVQCDPDWLAAFARWLRRDANMRSAPIVVAAEYVANGYPHSRRVVGSVLARADEPGEMLGYWRAHHGRAVKSSMKRGIGDALTRLYTQRSAMRYDSGPWRFGDVIEIVHPSPVSSEQSVLFRWLLDRRRHPNEAPPQLLNMVCNVRSFDAIEPERRRKHLRAEGLPAGVSWERLAGWLPDGMDREAWESVIPSMGYMALVRNLNNFDRSGVDPAMVRGRLTDAEAIERSRMLPFRFLTAYVNAETDNYKLQLSAAADVAAGNLPQFSGKTLIMVDCSASMGMSSVGSGRSRLPLSLSQLAAFMAESLGRACADARIVCYGNSITSTEQPARHVPIIRASASNRYFALGGTNTWRCTKHAADDYQPDRVVIITDEQAHDHDDDTVTCPIVTWNVAGYRPHHATHGNRNRYLISGVTDQAMQLLPTLISASSTGQWPWLTD